MSVKIKVEKHLRPKDKSKVKTTVYKSENVEIKRNKVASRSIQKGVRNNKENK